MRILKNISDYETSKQPLVLALGNFDGVHLGHQTLLKRVVDKARELQGIAAVMTFENHPQSVLDPSAKISVLTPNALKLKILQDLGLDLCFFIRFDSEFAQQAPGTFVRDILVEKLKIHALYLGYNARFGKDRAGDAEFLRRSAQECGFYFESVPGVEAAGSLVSSSRVRQLITKGDLQQTELCLGRPYSLLARVVHGDGRGKALGFPTANLNSLDLQEAVLPPQGVYAAQVRKVSVEKKEGLDWLQPGSEWYRGGVNYGTRPTFKDSQDPVAEVFVLGYKGSLYHEWLEVGLIRKLRDEKAFSSPDALQQQIQQDLKAIEGLFSGR
jgi:riboflavin kinase / FMN adenylyltransferase